LEEGMQMILKERGIEWKRVRAPAGDWDIENSL